MANSKYRKGYRAQKLERKFWEEKGYYVTEGQGSHGASDLVCQPTEKCSHSTSINVQVKAGLNKPTACNVKDLLQLHLNNAYKIVTWYSQKNKRSPYKVIRYIIENEKLLPVPTSFYLAV